eukprot:6487245-Amphidinium_carterae.2
MTICPMRLHENEVARWLSQTSGIDKRLYAARTLPTTQLNLRHVVGEHCIFGVPAGNSMQTLLACEAFPGSA